MDRLIGYNLGKKFRSGIDAKGSLQVIHQFLATDDALFPPNLFPVLIDDENRDRPDLQCGKKFGVYACIDGDEKERRLLFSD
jgi:hypothetical protein